MRAYIKKLQGKNEDTRKMIFTGTMIVSMSIVGLVWFYSLGTRFDSSVKEQANNDIKPFQLFGNSIKDTIKNVTASVGRAPTIKEVVTTKEEPASSAGEKQIDLIPIEYTN